MTNPPQASSLLTSWPALKHLLSPWYFRLGLALFFTGSIQLKAQPATTSIASKVSSALTFHATFDTGLNADFAMGNPRLFTLTNRSPKWEASPGLHTGHRTRLMAKDGLAGSGALRFTDHKSPWLFYEAKNNPVYRSKQWSGTVSLWLKVDPQKELAPGYCDPIQITPRQWNDAAFFVDFNKDGNPRDFRLGAFADLKVWNSKNENVNDIPENRRPLVPVRNPPFKGDQWTHVLFTWENFNTGRNDGLATLYLNGKRHGPLAGWNQTFTWSEKEQCRILIGLNYIGLLDELACFNRALNPEEVQFVYKNPSKIAKPGED
jgi:hypothetical protein